LGKVVCYRYVLAYRIELETKL